MTSSITSPPSSSKPFQFPPHYAFPPFFTLQPTLSTRTSQLQSWSSLIQAYCRHHHLFSLTLIDALSTPLFHNPTLHRRLSARDARAVVDWMSGADGDSRAEWIGAPPAAARKGAADDDSRARFWVFWRKPEEWAGVLEAWVDATGQKGSVLTLYELTESDATAGQEFHGMDAELLQRSLMVLVKRGTAQIFGGEGEMGVKFF